MAERLERLNIRTVQDLLFHLPLRYQDRTRVAPIGDLRPGDSATIVGQVELTQVHLGRRRSLLSLLSDGTGSLYLRAKSKSRWSWAGQPKIAPVP